MQKTFLNLLTLCLFMYLTIQIMSYFGINLANYYIYGIWLCAIIIFYYIIPEDDNFFTDPD